jgi:hypothetical protein
MCLGEGTGLNAGLVELENHDENYRKIWTSLQNLGIDWGKPIHWRVRNVPSLAGELACNGSGNLSCSS